MKTRIKINHSVARFLWLTVVAGIIVAISTNILILILKHVLPPSP